MFHGVNAQSRSQAREHSIHLNRVSYARYMQRLMYSNLKYYPLWVTTVRAGLPPARSHHFVYLYISGDSHVLYKDEVVSILVTISLYSRPSFQIPRGVGNPGGNLPLELSQNTLCNTACFLFYNQGG